MDCDSRSTGGSGRLNPSVAYGIPEFQSANRAPDSAIAEPVDADLETSNRDRPLGRDSMRKNG
jgi:hypothetical protein